MKSWSAAEAKRRFSAVLRAAGDEPQVVELRGKPVAVVLSFEAYSRNRKAFSSRSIAGWIEDLQPLHEREGDVDPPPRRDRTDQVGEGGA